MSGNKKDNEQKSGVKKSYGDAVERPSIKPPKINTNKK
jgi:hypothetical protein